MAKVDESDVDCDFLGLARSLSQVVYFSGHRAHLSDHLYGWYMDGASADCNRDFEEKDPVRAEL
jgi:hypothetical protein